MAFLKEPGLYSAVGIHHGKKMLSCMSSYCMLLCVYVRYLSTGTQQIAPLPTRLKRNLNDI